MEKGLIRYGLFLKQQLKKVTFWMEMLLLILLLWVVQKSVVPDQANRTVVLYCREDAEAQKLVKALMAQDSYFRFCKVTSREDAEKMVQEGSAECGFLCSDDFTDKLQNGETDELITYVSSVFTTKGEVAKEMVFAAFFPLYSEEIIKHTQESATDREAVQKQNQAYLSSNQIFRVKFVDAQNAAQILPKSGEHTIDPVRVTAAFSMFIIFILLWGEELAEGNRGILAALPVQEKRTFRWLRLCAGASLPAVICFLAIRAENPRGNMAAELVFWICYLSGCMIITGLLRKTLLLYSFLRIVYTETMERINR